MKLSLYQFRLWFNAVLLFLLVFVSSCDLTPVVHKKIIKAQEYVVAQEYDEAKQIYEEVLNYQVPPSLRAKILLQLAQIYSIQQSNQDKGYELFAEAKKLTELPSESIDAQEGMAMIEYYYFKNYEKAALSFKSLVKFRPMLAKHDYFQEMEALSYFKANNLNEAYQIFGESALSQNFENKAKALYYLGLIRFQQGRWQEAINCWFDYLKVEKRKESIVQTKFMMANAYETLGELKLAYNLYYTIQGEYPNTQILKKRMQGVFDRKVAQKR